jgi:hypothetical protein
MSFYKQLQTGWNIDWSLANFPSDLGDALITVQREGKGFGRKVMKNIPQALKATWNAEHDTGRKSAFDKVLKDAEEDGALLGIAGIRSAEDIAKDLNKLDTKNPVIAIKEWVEATGGTFEKSVRLALYKASIDLGLSRDDAGRIARETTTPFVRKGEWTQGLGLLYAFFGARVNGAAIALNAIRHPRVLKALGLMVGMDAALTLMNRAIMGDDDDGKSNWDKKRRDEKQNYFMLGFPNSEKALKLHVPRSYQWVHQLAMGMADMASGDYKASDFGTDMVTSVLNAFTPADTNTDAAQAITPTALRPVMQVYANKDSFGKAINPDYPHDKRPASEQTFKDTSPLAKDVSRLTNWLTGGDQVTEGKVSLKPGTLEHLTHFMLGGAGATALRLLDAPGKLASGEAGANDIPLARKVMSTADVRYDQREFYATTKEIEKLAERVDSYRKLGEREKAQTLIEENPTLWMRRVSAKAKADQVGKLRDRMDKLPEDSVERAQLEARIKAIMSGFNKLVRETKVKQ